MKPFLDDDFLLTNETAKRLYHDVAKKMPIFDYHCHLSPQEIYEDKHYRSITEIWLGGDHYKWRILRANGVDEEFITGAADDETKFEQWAKTVPETIGNPLFHWTHLELQRYFDIDELLTADNWKRIYDACNLKLKTLTARKIIEQSQVKVICTTDDPVDDLHYHELMARDGTLKTKVYPAFRPDKAINVELPTYKTWLAKLSALGFKIESISDYKAALIKRIDFFHQHNCRLADHALDDLKFELQSESEIDRSFKRVLQGQPLCEKELTAIKTNLILFFGREYAKRGWTQQYHLKALRNVNARMLDQRGPDTGFDAINDQPVAQPLAKYLNALELTDELPQTILYSLDEHDYQVLTSLAYCFQGGKIPGKIQLGSAWWFNDQAVGMNRQMDILANYGLLSKFIGMLTDSRSFLSYTRHEYFRRLLCDKLGRLVEAGEYPNDQAYLNKLVADISYQNAVAYFRFP